MTKPVSRPTILAIDDDLLARRLLRAVIGRARPDIHLLVVESGPDGIEAARNYRPSVVLLDLNLNGPMNGRQTLVALKADPLTAGIPVVIVTGEVHADEEMRAAGASGYVVKPFDVGEFAARVLAHCP